MWPQMPAAPWLNMTQAPRAGLEILHCAAIMSCSVSRAVAPMNVLAELMLPLVKVGGRMLAWKGPGVSDELDGARAAIELLGGRVERVFPVEIPGRDWAHNIVAVEKIARTPGKYPRRAGVPEKRPL